MNNFSNSIINQKIRSRKVCITSIGQSDGSDTNSFYARLEEDILAEDGYSLVVGLSSFGFKNSAWNISEQQQNNKLDLELIYDSGDPNNPNNDTIGNITIIIPDGMYGSLDDIFAILSSNELYYISSGFYVDTRISDEDDKYGDNIVKIYLIFTQTLYGFSIGLEADDKSCLWNATGAPGPIVDSYSNAQYLKEIKIKPNPNSSLYNILFTNTISDSTPSEINHSLTNKGTNPPEYISFKINKIDITVPDNIATVEPDPFNPFPDGRVLYDLYEPPDNRQLDTLNGHYQNDILPFKSLPWKAFFKPEFNPSYVDVICNDIQTLNMTTEGISKNVFHRQFLNGSDQNLDSIFQYFDTPIWMVQGNRDRISSLYFKFVAEGDKWVFYNMRFDIQLEVFEVPDEKIELQQPETFVLPGQDPLTNLANVYTGIQRNAFGAHDFSGKRGWVNFLSEGDDGEGNDNNNQYSNSNSKSKRNKKRR